MCHCKSRCIALQYLCMCNESKVFILFHIYGGDLVFLGGAGAPASPSLAPLMQSVDINALVQMQLVDFFFFGWNTSFVTAN